MNMKHFMVAALGSVVAFSSAQAADSVFDGFYMGGKVTGEASKYKNNAVDGRGSAGVGFGVFGGYRALMDSFCLGGEASVRYAGDKFTAGAENVKRSYVLGGHLLLGTVVNSQFLIAAKVGAEYAPYKSANGSTFGDTKAVTKKKTALNLGVLFEMPIADSLCIRAEGSVTPSVSLPNNVKATHQSYGAGLVYKIN